MKTIAIGTSSHSSRSPRSDSFLTALLTGGGLLWAGAARAAVITNGSFESPMTGAPYPTGWGQEPPPNFGFDGWTVTRTGDAASLIGYPSVEALTNDYPTETVPIDGTHYLRIMADRVAEDFWPLVTTLINRIDGLTVGETYAISLSYKAGLRTSGTLTWDTTTGDLLISTQSLSGVNTSLMTIDTFDSAHYESFNDPGGMTYDTSDWSTVVYQFTATESTHFLNLVSVISGDPTMLFLDNIQISQVPEPASACLCGAGLLALLMRRSRR